MALGLLGDDVDQASAARRLKPDPDDKNVSPQELEAFVRDRGLGVRRRVAGDRRQLQSLLALGLPVVVETWFVPDPGDEMGHYLLLTGYQGLDEAAQGHFLAADSYHGPGVELPYADFDRLWRVFNRIYLVLYPPEREAEVSALLGPADADSAMWQAAASQALAELGQTPDDAFAAFNLGSSLLALGDIEGAATAFDRARAIGLPWRMLWYQEGPFEAYAATERWSELAALAQANLANAGKHEESHYWLGRALEGLGDPEGAALAYQRAIQDHPGFVPAQQALEGQARPAP
ncbi:MAG: tetratricopeptide repeat protein [Chloroflexi bacterium]|nr:tetratricopeptide repeat protein [Chloroflexota bacterium]